MISDDIIKNLLKTKSDGYLYHRESQTLEFKEQFNLNGLADYFRDFAAFSNNKGGYLIFGVKDNPYTLVGLSKKSLNQFNKIDPEMITGFLLDIFAPSIDWVSSIIKVGRKNFGVFYVNEAREKPVIAKKDEGKDQIIKNGEIYYRYGGRTQKIQFAELQGIIQSRLQLQTKQWQNLIAKIAKTGPANAAILDTERGLIEKNDTQVLVMDSELAKKIKFIKEGEFTEKRGETALRLVGDVQPINSVEITRIEKQKLTEEYPYSALELVDEIKKRIPSLKQNDVWKVIADNNLKSNESYSVYNFRNKKQEEEYKTKEILSLGVPSIYNYGAVDFIVKILKNRN